jgi:hypothetical protein
MSVYFITARETGTVKIGCARDPEDRLSKLQTSSPVKLALEAIIFGSYETECDLHARFAEHRVRGEWFKLTDEIEEIIRKAEFSPGLTEPKLRCSRPLESDEELVERWLKKEREYYDEVMRWRAKHAPETAQVSA